MCARARVCVWGVNSNGSIFFLGGGGGGIVMSAKMGSLERESGDGDYL